MKHQFEYKVLAVVIVLAAAASAIYVFGGRRGSPGTEPAPSPKPAAEATKATPESGEDATRRHLKAGLKAGDIDPVTGKKILYYHDPMVPGNRFDKPAKSPFMDMMLSPVYSDGTADSGSITVSPRIQQNLGIRTSLVTEGVLSPEVSTVGNVAWNERDQVVVQARATGFVERLHVRATLDRVAKGQPLAELYVPEWISAQEEFLAIRAMRGEALADLVDAARQRMRQVGMNDAQIALVEGTGRTQARITIYSPIGGVVSELSVREGMTVAAGATLFRINGLGTVWAYAEIPESEVALVRPGAKVQARSPAVPGTTFDGRVQAILPEVNATTRTLKARLEIPNPRGQLAPGMFVQMRFTDMHAEKSLLVPTEAIIQTGRRSVVMLAEDDGRYRPVDVEIGLETGGQTEIKRGLAAGQRVVVSSQFLIDSEASLRGVEARLNGEPAPTATNTAPRHEGEATIERIDGETITLSHGPIPSLKWRPMTMEFKLPPGGPSKLPRGLAAGDRVGFEFYMGADDTPQITHIHPLPPDAHAHPGGKP